MTAFHERASGRTYRNAWAYPKGFPDLQWQLFAKRVEKARTMRAIKLQKRRNTTRIPYGIEIIPQDHSTAC